MKKIYFSVLYIIINLMIMFGIILPYLFSEKSDIAVLFGAVLLIADISHLVFFIRNLIVKFKN